MIGAGALAAVPGSLVEFNDYAVSVHYRNVADDDRPAVDQAVEKALEAQPTLTRFPGKMVVELRPDVEWNKGKAVEFILERLEASLRRLLRGTQLGRAALRLGFLLGQALRLLRRRALARRRFRFSEFLESGGRGGLGAPQLLRGLVARPLLVGRSLRRVRRCALAGCLLRRS